MAADESVRYRLQRKLDELVGPEEAAELMASTPPFPWTELATKRDLDLLGRELRSEMQLMRGELLSKIGSVEGKIGSQTRTIILANFVSVLTAVGLVLATIQMVG
jgi:hypothetical protein